MWTQLHLILILKSVIVSLHNIIVRLFLSLCVWEWGWVDIAPLFAVDPCTGY